MSGVRGRLRGMATQLETNRFPTERDMTGFVVRAEFWLWDVDPPAL